MALALLAAGCTPDDDLVGSPPRVTDTATDRGSASDGPSNGAETYHVSASAGDGGDGSAEEPFATLERGLEALQPGDTLVVGGGTYDERIKDPDIRPGTEDAPITVRAADGERPVLQGLLWLEDADWWTVDGINVTWSPENKSKEHMVKFTGGTGWTFSGAEVWDAQSFAAILVAGDPEAWLLTDLHVHDTRDTNGTNQDHLIYLNSGSGGGVVERSLLEGSPNGRAIKIGADDVGGRNVENLTIRYNTMIDNRGPSNVQLAYRSSSNVIERNIMVGAAEGRANVTTYDLTGEGNVVRQNVGWGSTGVLDEDDEAKLDGGGNKHLNPRLDDEGAPQTPEARDFGHLAPSA